MASGGSIVGTSLRAFVLENEGSQAGDGRMRQRQVWGSSLSPDFLGCEILEEFLYLSGPQLIHI